MVEYARQDTHYLIYIYERMKEAVGQGKTEEQRRTILQGILQGSKDTCL